MMRMITLLLLLLPTCGLCNFLSPEFTKKKDRSYSEGAEIIFEGRVVLEKWQFEDRDGFHLEIDYPEKANPQEYSRTLEFFTHHLNPNARYANYLVSFKPDSVIKGDAESLKNLKWNYRNSFRSMCPHYPKELVHGGRFRFYLSKISGKDEKRVAVVKCLLLPNKAGDSDSKD